MTNNHRNRIKNRSVLAHPLEGEPAFPRSPPNFPFVPSTVMTSNRPLEDWGKLIGDVPSATAILDRFLHHAEVLTITGKSYRLRNQSAAPPVAKGKKVTEPESAACVE